MITNTPELKVEREAPAFHHHPGVYPTDLPFCPGCVHVGDHDLRARLMDNYPVSLGNTILGPQVSAQYISPQELACIKPGPALAVSDEDDEWVIVKGSKPDTEYTILVSEMSPFVCFSST